MLQQILFYREQDLSLDIIRQIIHQSNFDVEKTLEEHLSVLLEKKQRILALIRTVELTLSDLKGEYQMSDQMKFEAFKKNIITEQEKTYGKEAREKYGNIQVEESHQKILRSSRRRL